MNPRRGALVAVTALAGICCAAPVCAQAASSACTERTAPSVRRIATETAGSFRYLPSRENAAWLLAGGGAAIATHPGDTAVTRRLSSSDWLDTIFGPGAFIGGAAAQLGAAVGTYSIGRIAKSPCVGAVGADLLRAQLVAQTLTWALQHSVRRTRPDNGSGFAFPSGHASVTFASATVLERQFGWKAGVPAYALASYVAVSRLQANRHFLSDVVFGAAVGIVSGRAATFGQNRSTVVVPSVGNRSAGLLIVHGG